MATGSIAAGETASGRAICHTIPAAMVHPANAIATHGGFMTILDGRCARCVKGLW